jgi:hypothetical protein
LIALDHAQQRGNGSSNHQQTNLSAAIGRGSMMEDGQVKIEFDESAEEREPILSGGGRDRIQSTSRGDDYGGADDGNGGGGINTSSNNELQQQQRRRGKISVAGLRQVLFISLCTLIVLASLAVLFLML